MHCGIYGVNDWNLYENVLARVRFGFKLRVRVKVGGRIRVQFRVRVGVNVRVS
jgi:hypothetical protein